MEKGFILSKGTKLILNAPHSLPIDNAVSILQQDMEKVLTTFSFPDNSIVLSITPDNRVDHSSPETFSFSFSMDSGGSDILSITGSDTLGLIYGILHISCCYLGIEPLWFWNDQRIEKKEYVVIPAEEYHSQPFFVRYRGWFINDEVLLLGWKKDRYDKDTWKPIFEALLRYNGNMIIPGTGMTNKKTEAMAADMGLYLTHHHAEPLGAELFLSAYPDLEAKYGEHSHLFEALWRDAIKRQRDKNVIWGLGFRGQGDRAFWDDDPSYKDDKSRGKFISDIITRQYQILTEYIEKPICCTSLYGEIMDLYKKGYITVPEGVMKVWADSGYGKMISRRQGNDNQRIQALPDKEDSGPHGLYYHVAFHDLQASNHLTMSPHSPAFIRSELRQAFALGANQYILVNCGNLKPHVYFLDYVAKLWTKGDCDPGQHMTEYIRHYYPEIEADLPGIVASFLDASLQYGKEIDERAGEEFYHYPVRAIATHWIKNVGEACEESLRWATGEKAFSDQVAWYGDVCSWGLQRWRPVMESLKRAASVARHDMAQLIEDTFLLQATIHYSGCTGAFYMCESYQFYKKGEIFNAWLKISEALVAYTEGIKAMRAAEHDQWTHFYRNDCLCNLELTVYTLEALRKYLRILGDGPEFINWQRQFLLPEAERRIMLQTTTIQQPKDDTLFEAVQRKIHL